VPKRIGTVVIDLAAGTSRFTSDINQAEVRVKKFGSSGSQAMREFGGHTASSMMAASGAIRTMEGNLTHNVRAVERFMSTTLGLSPVLQAAFPIVGAVAFSGLIVGIGEKVYEFFKTIQNAPEKVNLMFRELNAPLKLTNDQLDVTNDRLENQIAKLEGRRQNTLKLALDEARAAADNLAMALDRDLSALYKLLKESDVGIMRRLLGETGTKYIREFIGGKAGGGGMKAEMDVITDQGRAKIEAAGTIKDPKLQTAAIAAAREKTKSELKDFFDAKLAILDKRIADAEEARKNTLRYETSPKSRTLVNPQGVPSLVGHAATTENTVELEELKEARRYVAEQARYVPKKFAEEDLAAKKEKLTSDAENAKLDRPFQDRMKKLAAELAAAKAKVDAAGLSEAEKAVAAAYGESLKIIEEVNKALERRHTQLSTSQKDSIKAIELQIVTTGEEEKWKTKLAQTTAQIRNSVRSQETLTAAIGKGYEAIKKANVETRVAAAVGAEKYNDEIFMLTHLNEVTAVRSKYAAEYEAKHLEQAKNASDKLMDEITLENRLAQVQSQGAEAVRLATLQVKLAKMQEDGATKEQIKAELDLFKARGINQSAAAMTRINERIAATKRLTAAITEGAEAERRAALKNRAIESVRSGGTPIPGAGGLTQEAVAEAGEARLEHQRQITAEAMRTGLIYKNQLEALNQQITTLELIIASGHTNFEIELSLRNLRNDQLRILAEQSLAMRGMRDGVRAFFLDMQRDGKSAAESIYEAFHMGFDRVTGELAKLATFQKTSFSKVFQDIGGHVVEGQIKGMAQKGLGALGKAFPKLSGLTDLIGGGKPDFTKTNPGYMKLADSLGLGGARDGLGKSIGGLFGEGDKGGGIFSLLASSLIPHASGGPVSPGSAYLVGERGAEPFFPNSPGTIMSNASARRAFGGGGPNAYYAIDARGTDPVLTEQRTRMGILAAHRDAVGTAVRVNADRLRRVPYGTLSSAGN